MTATQTRMHDATANKQKHDWAGSEFCDCWRCSDKADWAGEKFADN